MSKDSAIIEFTKVEDAEPDTEDDGIEFKEPFNLVVNPKIVKLYKLLELAEAHRQGGVAIRGELEDKSTQWGIVVVAGKNSGNVMNALEKTLHESSETWPDDEVTKEDVPIN